VIWTNSAADLMFVQNK